jgi:hypothetical protein
LNPLLIAITSSPIFIYKEVYTMGYFAILAAIPGFFLSSFFLMLLWGAIAPDLGIEAISYVTSMLVTITLWLAVAPLAATAGRRMRE